jgi:hypothetical protein
MSESSTSSLPTLGESAELIEVDTRDQLASLSLAMASQCRRSLDIVSRHLDPELYDNEAFSEALKRCALNNHRVQIRIFIIDARPLLSRGHRVLELANRLPSSVVPRAPARQHKNFNEAYLIADKIGYIQRQFSDRFEAQVDFFDRRLATSLAARFELMWQHGVPETRFRRLHI